MILCNCWTISIKCFEGERDCSAITCMHTGCVFQNFQIRNKGAEAKGQVGKPRDHTWDEEPMSVSRSEHWSQPSTSIAVRITAGFYGYTAGISLLEGKNNITLLQTRGSDCLTIPAELVHLSLCYIVSDPPLNYCLSCEGFFFLLKKKY